MVLPSNKNLFNNDKKKYGFREQNKDLEIILLGEDCKLIAKIYKLLLKRYTADEAVKEQMIEGAVSINVEITME